MPGRQAVVDWTETEEWLLSVKENFGVSSLAPHSRGKNKKTDAAWNDSSVLGIHVDRTNSKILWLTLFWPLPLLFMAFNKSCRGIEVFVPEE